MKRTYITVTNAEFYETLKEDAEGEGATVWTVGRHIRKGDRIPLYVGRPVMAIVAVGEASEDAWVEEDPSSEWYGHHFVEIHGLRMLARPVTRSQMLAEIPGWGWPKMPGCGANVPSQHMAQLEALFAEAASL
jgi:hypothetical protein